MKIFSGSSNRQLAEKLALKLELQLSPLENFTFPDGERRIQIQDDVLDEEVVVVQSTNTPVDMNYIELFLIMDGLHRSGAKAITVIMPYMGYQRQDHIFRDGEAVSLDVMVRILETMQLSRFITIDPHTIKLEQFFHVPFSDLTALELFASTVEKNNWNNKDTVLVSPDMGGLRRIKLISTQLNNMGWIATVKDRDLDTGSIVIKSFEGPLQVSDLEGKNALIVDDMVSSGKTILECASFLKAHGVSGVKVFITHPIFSKDAPQLLQNSEADKVFVTDSVWIPDDKRFEKLEILSVAEMIANELQSNT